MMWRGLTALATAAALATTIVALNTAAAGPVRPAPAIVPTYTASEPATAVADPAIVYIEQTYAGYVRDAASGILVAPDQVVFQRRCSGVAVHPDGYVVTTGVCAQPSAEIVVVNALYKLGRSRVAAGELTEGALGAFVAARSRSTVFTGERPGTAPRVVLTARFGATDPTTAPPLTTTATVLTVQPANAGNVALLRLDRGGLHPVELATRLARGGDQVVIIGYDGYGAAAHLRDRLVPVVAGSPGKRWTVGGEVGPYSRGGAAVDQTGRLIGLLDADADLPSEPHHDLIALADVRRLLDAAGVANVLSESDRQYRQAMASYLGGHFTDAAARFGAVLRADPGHPGARAYLDRARVRALVDGDAVDNRADWLGYLLSIAAGVLVLVLVNALWRLLTRRST
jgi:hypothetical protein